MVSIHQMANGYVEQLRFKVKQTEEQLTELTQLLQECENELQFGAAYQNSPPLQGATEAPVEGATEGCCSPTGGDDKEGCCKSTDIPSSPLTLESLENAETSQ